MRAASGYGVYLTGMCAHEEADGGSILDHFVAMAPHRHGGASQRQGSPWEKSRSVRKLARIASGGPLRRPGEVGRKAEAEAVTEEVLLGDSC